MGCAHASLPDQGKSVKLGRGGFFYGHANDHPSTDARGRFFLRLIWTRRLFAIHGLYQISRVVHMW